MSAPDVENTVSIVSFPDLSFVLMGSPMVYEYRFKPDSGCGSVDKNMPNEGR